MATTIQLRGGTAADWASVNTVVPAEREMCVETDTHLFKIGDGFTPWSDLPYNSETDPVFSAWLAATPPLMDSSVFATAAQGALADTALQDATAFATAAQGALADTALQDATAFATTAQGALADSALQPDGDGSGVSFSDPASLISTLTPYFVNWGGYPFAGLVMGDGSGNSSAAVAGTDYLAPTGDGSGLTELTISQITDFPTIPDISGYSSLFDGTGGNVAFADTAGNASGGNSLSALFDGTGGNVALAQTVASISGMDGSGLTGVQLPLTAGTDYQTPLVAGTDYQTPLVAGTDYQIPLTAGTDYLAPTGDGSGLTGVPDPSGYSSLFDGTGGNVALAVHASDAAYADADSTMLLSSLFDGTGGNVLTAASAGCASYAIYADSGSTQYLPSLFDGTGGSVINASNATYAGSAINATTDDLGNDLSTLFDGTGGWVAYSVGADTAASAGTAGNAYYSLNSFEDFFYTYGYTINGTNGDFLQSDGDASGLSNIPSPFDQSVNTTDSPSFFNLTLTGSTITFYGGSKMSAINGTSAIAVATDGDASGVTGIKGSQIDFATSAPAAAEDTGNVGQIANDGTYFYLCTAANTWVKADIATLGFSTW